MSRDHDPHPSVNGRAGVLLLVDKRREPKLCGACTRPSENPLCSTCDAKVAAEMGPRRRPGGGRG